MAAKVFRVATGLSLLNETTGDYVSVVTGSDDPSVAGYIAEVGSLYLRTTGEIFIKTGANNTDWSQILDENSTGTEDQYIRNFIGKDLIGDEMPSYPSNNHITDLDSLETSISDLDAYIGASPTANVRTNNAISSAESVNENIESLDDAIGLDSQLSPVTRTTGGLLLANSVYQNLDAVDTYLGDTVVPNVRTNNPVTNTNDIGANIEALDDAIGTDAQLTNTNYVSLAQSVNENLSDLDAQVKLNSDSITALQSGLRWIEPVDIVTGDDLSSASGTSYIFSDDDGGAPTLTAGMRVASLTNNAIYLVAAGAWTAVVPALSDKDTFVTTINLPDPPSQEGQAVYTYDTNTIVKIMDLDFELASTINLTGTYTPANGTVAAGNSIEAAISKLDANQADLITLSGVSQGATNLGAFTGTIIPDAQTVKAAIQALETQVDTNVTDITNLEAAVGSDTGLAGLAYTENNYVADGESLETSIDKLDMAVGSIRLNFAQNNVTGAVTIDSLLVDTYEVAKWFVECVNVATPENKIAMEIYAIHDGTAAADATSVDYNRYAILRTSGNIAGLTVSVDISGTAAAQVMRLRVASSTAVNVKAIRAFTIKSA